MALSGGFVVENSFVFLWSFFGQELLYFVTIGQDMLSNGTGERIFCQF